MVPMVRLNLLLRVSLHVSSALAGWSRLNLRAVSKLVSALPLPSSATAAPAWMQQTMGNNGLGNLELGADTAAARVHVMCIVAMACFGSACYSVGVAWLGLT